MIVFYDVPLTSLVVTSSSSTSFRRIMCEFCDGREVLDEVEIPGTNGLTCEFAAYTAASVESTSEGCAGFQAMESICCSGSVASPVSDPCKFCDGKEILEDVEIPGLDGATCGLVAVGSLSMEATTDECSGLELVELVCCPDSPIDLSTESSPSDEPAETTSPSRYVVSLLSFCVVGHASFCLFHDVDSHLWI